MLEKLPFNHIGIYKKVMMDYEKNMNEVISLLFDYEAKNIEFSKGYMEAYIIQIENVKDIQKRWLNDFYLPTKKDVKTLSNLILDVEEKISSNENYVLDLSDEIKDVNSEMKTVVEKTKEMIKIKRQVQNELTKLRNEIKENNQLKEMEALKAEVENLKLILLNNTAKEISIESEEIAVKEVGATKEIRKS
jgi:Ni,Fe-hydrogenase I large subunit